MRIFLDFEATEAGEIIAIGAVAEDDSRYFAVCKPQFTPLTERITALTGIDERTLENANPYWMVARDFQTWCKMRDASGETYLYSFGKNDRGFAQLTLNMYRSHGYDSPACLNPMAWVYANLENGANPIYKAFNRPLVGLRSAYLTYKNDTGDLHQSHNPLDDAIMFRELVLAAEDGWRLPQGAELVKVEKPVLPSKAPKEDFCTPAELHRTVVCYWTKGNQDKSAVYRDLVTAAKALCTKAINSGVSPEQAAYRVLQAALNGDSYCDRRFFLVG